MDVLPILSAYSNSLDAYCIYQNGELVIYNGGVLPPDTIFLDSIISGGDFREYLRDAMRRGRHICLVLLPRSVCFKLPCPDGEFKELEVPPVKLGEYSDSLMCYFSFCATDATVTLTDDELTLWKKLQVADEVGIPCCIAPYSLREKMKTP